MKRRVGRHQVTPIGFGCMSLSHAYGVPPSDAEGERLLNLALDLGYDFLDTASLYGMGHNETLIGRALKSRRHEYVLASKCGIVIDEHGRRVVNGRPDVIVSVLDESLMRLGVDHIDLYYLHRLDPEVPIEESMGALKQAVEAGKIGAIGLSEVSAATLRRAHAIHPVAALQTEYSLWTRNAEIAVLDACRELGTAFVAFSPVARGFLADAVHSPQDFVKGDIRAAMPRFQEPHFSRNHALLEAYHAMAREAGCTPGRLALAWLLHRDPGIIPIPGTASAGHLAENLAARDVALSADQMDRLDMIINRHTVSGDRYSPSVQQQIDTEEFA